MEAAPIVPSAEVTAPVVPVPILSPTKQSHRAVDLSIAQQQELLESYTKRELIAWMEKWLNSGVATEEQKWPALSIADFVKPLKDGEMLCVLINKIWPGTYC